VRLVAGIMMLAVLSRTAAADDEEARVHPVRPLTTGLYFTGLGGAIDGVSTGGMGPTVELALGAGRTQVFVEGGVAWMQYGSLESREGFMVRGGVGARWIARSFELGDEAAVEMTLDGLVGADKIWWEHGGRLVRPELGLGVGLQMRKFHAPHVHLRFIVRVLFTPTDDDGMTAARCTGRCASASPLANGGMMFSIGGAL